MRGCGKESKGWLEGRREQGPGERQQGEQRLGSGRRRGREEREGLNLWWGRQGGEVEEGQAQGGSKLHDLPTRHASLQGWRDQLMISFQ